MSPFCAIEEALDELRAGRMVVVVDDEGRENEGDLVVAAEFATPAIVNTMIRSARGLVCVALDDARLRELEIGPMVSANTAAHGTAFMVSVDLIQPAASGVSAYDRSATLTALAGPGWTAQDFARPGHVFPLRAEPDGVLARQGHTEAACDLVRLAGLRPAAVLVEVVDDDGRMARLPALERFARLHDLRIVSIADLVSHRRRQLVRSVASCRLPTRHGSFEAVAYRSAEDGRELVALVRGEVSDAEDVLVRVHSQCLTGDAFRSQRCDCGEQLEAALSAIDAEPCGVLVYATADEGRGIGLIEKLRAYELQDRGLDTVEANARLGFPPDLRDYRLSAAVLADLGVSSARLLTNNPAKAGHLRANGLSVSEIVPLRVTPNAHNVDYLRTKRRRMGHRLDCDEAAGPESAEYGPLAS